MKLETITDQETRFTLIDFGDGEIGIIDTDDALESTENHWQVEIWQDHAHNGAGASNWQLDAFGRILDLEFCSTRSATPEEWDEFNDHMEELGE